MHPPTTSFRTLWFICRFLCPECYRIQRSDSISKGCKQQFTATEATIAAAAASTGQTVIRTLWPTSLYINIDTKYDKQERVLKEHKNRRETYERPNNDVAPLEDDPIERNNCYATILNIEYNHTHTHAHTHICIYIYIYIYIVIRSAVRLNDPVFSWKS